MRPRHFDWLTYGRRRILHTVSADVSTDVAVEVVVAVTLAVAVALVALIAVTCSVPVAAVPVAAVAVTMGAAGDFFLSGPPLIKKVHQTKFWVPLSLCRKNGH